MPLTAWWFSLTRNKHGIYINDPLVPCPPSKFLMSPSVGLSFNFIGKKWRKCNTIRPMSKFTILNFVGQPTFAFIWCLLFFTGMEIKTWSECTKKQIDTEFERREASNNNCFFTWQKTSTFKRLFPPWKEKILSQFLFQISKHCKSCECCSVSTFALCMS